MEIIYRFRARLDQLRLTNAPQLLKAPVPQERRYGAIAVTASNSVACKSRAGSYSGPTDGTGRVPLARAIDMLGCST